MVERLLILGGTTEAAEFARRADPLKGLTVITSLAGRTRQPAPLPGTVRRGGFGGVDGLVRYLRTERIGAVIDATHPFAVQISAHAVEACAAAGRPRLVLQRPPWIPQPEDQWHSVPDTQTAVRTLEPGDRVFLTVGRQELAAFADRTDVRFLARMIDVPETPFPDHFEIVTGRGPFSVADERRILIDHGITCLVAKNSGGEASYGKIVATRELAIPVVMIQRPAPPPGPVAETVEGAMEWLAAVCDE